MREISTALIPLREAVDRLDSDPRYGQLEFGRRIATARTIGLAARADQLGPILHFRWATDLVPQVANDLVDVDREFRRAAAFLQPEDAHDTVLTEVATAAARTDKLFAGPKQQDLPRPVRSQRASLAIVAVDSGSADAWLAPVGLLSSMLLSQPIQLFLTVLSFWDHRHRFTGAARSRTRPRDNPSTVASDLLRQAIEATLQGASFSVDIAMPELRFSFQSPPQLPRRR